MPRQPGVRSRNRNVSKVEVSRQSNIVLNQKSNFGSVEDNLGKYVEFASWVIWYPDLFLDLLKPKEGGITLHSDQRIFLRCATRFFSVYGCFPRGWGKTWGEVAAMYVVAIRYPNIELSMTAQSKENAADLLSSKTTELLRQYPMLDNEIVKTQFRKGFAEVLFKNGSKIDILANAQTSKGQRRKRINIEESALLNNELFEDALKPIVEVPRYTCGKLSVVNPEELNQQVNFFTTPAFRGSDEWQRNLRMIRNMVDLKGDFVLGADWMLACWYGRGSTKSQILERKKTSSPIFFAQNFGGKWTGSSSNALVNINKLMDRRVLTSAQFEAKANEEFYIAVDVARSQNTNNNQSSIVVGKVCRAPNNKITSIDIVNLFNISNALNFSAQAAIVKKTKRAFNARMVIVDGNGLGSGLVDELLKESYDPTTKESLGCFDTVNTDNAPEIDTAEKCLYDLKAQSAQTRIITTFIDMVDSGKLRLLEKRHENIFADIDDADYEREILPFLQTDILIEEISNLKIKYLNNGGITVEKVVSKLNKDRFSALAYLLWYINEFQSYVPQSVDYDAIESTVTPITFE
jgi:ribonucleoside-diphosphate reductase alpha chain